MAVDIFTTIDGPEGRTILPGEQVVLANVQFHADGVVGSFPYTPEVGISRWSVNVGWPENDWQNVSLRNPVTGQTVYGQAEWGLSLIHI